jgi:pantoate--beta-alanine ligase
LQLISDIQETSTLCQKWREQGETIAFVPTMGCLHEGHLSLVEKAKQLADRVVVSIFVNPLQFGENEDFSSYPRTLAEDEQKLLSYSPDLLFIPEAGELYPEGKENVEQIELGEITMILEGANRPGHFAGVATVVKRLFELVKPNVAVFGEKDFQQLMVIKQLVAKLALNIEIVGMPTFRAEDGLALSSRNAYLSPAERQSAAEIYKTLNWVRDELCAGNLNYRELEIAAQQRLEKAGFTPDYVVIRASNSLNEPLNDGAERVVLVAARLGKTRLIDNIRV